MCIDPDIDPVSSNYIYESSMNELIVIHDYIRGNSVGFKVKFSSNKPESKKSIYFENL